MPGTLFPDSWLMERNERVRAANSASRTDYEERMSTMSSPDEVVEFILDDMRSQLEDGSLHCSGLVKIDSSAMEGWYRENTPQTEPSLMSLLDRGQAICHAVWSILSEKLDTSRIDPIQFDSDGLGHLTYHFTIASRP